MRFLPWKKLFLKKIGITFSVLVIMFCGLQFECTQKALIRVLIKTFTHYKASELKMHASYKFPFQANIQSITLVKDHHPVATLKNIEWKITSIFFQDIDLSISQCVVKPAAEPLNFDFSNLSPSAIGYFLQTVSHSLQRFSTITIADLQIDQKKLAMQLKRQDDQSVAVISHNQEALTLTLMQAGDHAKLSLNGIWEEKKLQVDAKIYSNAIDFSACANLTPFVSEQVANMLGREFSLSGRLEKATNWQLLPLTLTTDRGHKIHGSCANQNNSLDGNFIWTMPLPNTQTTAQCQIKIEGSPNQPKVKWEFQSGIAPLEKAFGECTLVDTNHIKLSGQLHHDAKNTAQLSLEISLNPLLINGHSTVKVDDLQKFLGIFWPSAKGSLNFDASFKDVSSLKNGHIVVNGHGVVHDSDFHLPIEADIDIDQGLGKGKFSLTNGHYQQQQLDAHIIFTTTENEIHVDKCKLQLGGLQLALLKPITYYLQAGLSNAQMQFCGGSIVLENLKLGSLENTTGSITIRNIQLSGLKAFLDVENLTGIVNGSVQKLQGKPLSLKLNLTKSFWEQSNENHTYKILNDLSAVLDAEFADSTWKWQLNVKDQDKIKLETKGNANFKDHTIDAYIKGLVRLKLLTDWLATGDRIFGDITLNLHAKGSINSPILEGTVDADNGLYEHSEVGTFYQNITIRTKAQGKRLIVNQFTAQDVTKSKDPEHGQLRGEGWIDFSDPFSPDFNVPMHLFHLRIAQNDGFIGDACGVLTITGKGSEVGCKGEVSLEKVNYFLEQSMDVKVPKIVNRILKQKKIKKNKQYSTAFPLDILVHAPPGSSKVTGSGADTSWQGDFYVKKSIVNPFLVGTLQLHEGTLDIMGKVLHVSYGQVTFVDDDRNNPRFDIRATKKLDAGITVAVEIKGTGDKTIIDFTSTPSMPKEEVLSLLLFGKKLGEVSVLQSIQLAELAKTEDSSAGFFEKIRSNFGFDQFEFKTTTRGGASETDEDATPEERAAGKTSQAVRIGKEFGKVQIAIEQGAGSETSKVVVSTPLGNNLALQGDVGAAQNSGVGVSWIKRY